MSELRRMVGLSYDGVKCTFDVLMDNYTWYAGVQFLLDAEFLAFQLLDANPHAKIEIRKIETHTQLLHCTMGVPTDHKGDPV